MSEENLKFEIKSILKKLKNKINNTGEKTKIKQVWVQTDNNKQ